MDNFSISRDLTFDFEKFLLFNQAVISEEEDEEIYRKVYKLMVKQEFDRDSILYFELLDEDLFIYFKEAPPKGVYYYYGAIPSNELFAKQLIAHLLETYT